MTSQSPYAPESALMSIIETFRGRRIPGQLTNLVVSFDNKSDQQNAASLINMLKGWSAEEDPNMVGLINIKKAP